MFRKIVDVLKEVFWIKPSPKKSKATRRKKAGKAVAKKSPAKKKIARKIPKPSVKPVPKLKLTAVKKPAKSAVKMIDPSLTELGVITHYFERIKVCVVKVTQGTILIGDKLTILGVKTKFVQKVWSMQIESEDVKVAKKGQLIGLKVDKLVAVGDKVYK
jgi:hypothetical protein